MFQGLVDRRGLAVDAEEVTEKFDSHQSNSSLLLFSQVFRLIPTTESTSVYDFLDLYGDQRL